MCLGLFTRQLAGLQQLVDERVVLGELLHAGVADQVCTRIAHMPERHVLPADEGDRDRRAHAGGVRVGARAVIDTAVGLLDQVRDALLAAGSGAALLQGGGREPGSDLAGHGSSHPVRDREERRLDHIGVLVVPPRAAGIGDCGDPPDHCSNLRSVSPTRTMSPSVSRRGCSSRMPLR